MELVLKDETIKPLLKEVIYEMLEENKNKFREIFEEVIEDIYMAKAIQDGLNSEISTKKELYKVLDED